MCEQTRCDANATCGLTRGAPVCTCKSGYLPMGSGTRPTCVRDLACSELNCSENARCELGSDQLRHCVCKDGYTGDGKNCTAISCPAFSTLRTDHRRVSPSDGPTTVGKVATFTCDPGYKVTSGGSLVCDEEGHWSGTPTVCSLITCGKPTATVEHGVLTTPAQASYEVNDRATYKCDTGYKGAEVSITCSREGTWPATTPPLNCIKACGDGTVDDGEQCDPAHDDALSAWTCDATCKRCPGGVCDLACTSPAISACPRVSGGWNKTCPAGKCVLTGCTTGSFNPRPCPDGSMCSNATCVTASASGD
jgi:hypothetical protein